MLRQSDKVVCCCSWGQVRSVAARNLLIEKYGMRNVLACGLDMNSRETLDMLFTWADTILVVGDDGLWEKVPQYFRRKALRINIGHDSWGYNPPHDLKSKLSGLIAQAFGA